MPKQPSPMVSMMMSMNDMVSKSEIASMNVLINHFYEELTSKQIWDEIADEKMKNSIEHLAKGHSRGVAVPEAYIGAVLGYAKDNKHFDKLSQSPDPKPDRYPPEDVKFKLGD